MSGRTEKMNHERWQVWVPARLDAAIEAESRRRLLSKSALVRQIVAERLGLLAPSDLGPVPQLTSAERGSQ